MQGLAAISANNGWAMAFIGASIVMTGLALLALIISQLHKIVELIEKKKKKSKKSTPEKVSPITEPETRKTNFLNDPATAARIYKALTAEFGDTFELSKLYQIVEKENLPHPHITIRTLREAGYLASEGEGSFSWKNI